MNRRDAIFAVHGMVRCLVIDLKASRAQEMLIRSCSSALVRSRYPEIVTPEVDTEQKVKLIKAYSSPLDLLCVSTCVPRNRDIVPQYSSPP